MLCPNGEFQGLCNNNSNTFISLISIGIQYMLAAAVVLALVFLIWGGIKWIIAAGNKERVEGAKRTIIHALVGLAITFTSFYLLNFVGQLYGIDALSSMRIFGR